MQSLKIDNGIIKAKKALMGPNLHPVKNIHLEIIDGVLTQAKAHPTATTREVLNATHCTLLPGLVDCHVHLALDGINFKGCMDKWQSPGLMASHIKKQLNAGLEQGLTYFRDGGDRGGQALTFKNLSSTNLPIKASGAALRIQKMYGTFLGPGLKKEQIKEAIAFLAGKNADHIKVLVSGIVSFKEYGRVGPQQFDLPSLREVVYRASKEGLKVMAHANSEEAVRTCIQAGVHSVEHGYFLSHDTLKMMAEKHIYWVPTIVPVANQLKKFYLDRFSKDELNVIEKTYKRQQEMLCWACEWGVTVGVGTDAGASGVLHGTGFHEELQLYREAGLSCETIVKAATINGAKILGLNSGLEQGKPLRFTAVAGDPLEDLNILKKPEYIYLHSPD